MLLSVLSVVIEEVHFLMRQRESTAILLLFATVQKSHYPLKCLIHTRFHSMCTSEGQCNVSSAHWEQEDILCCYNCESDDSRCVFQCFTQWLCCFVSWLTHKLPLFYKLISHPFQHDGVSWSCCSRCDQQEKRYHWNLKCHKQLLPHQPQVSPDSDEYFQACLIQKKTCVYKLLFLC